MHQQQHGEDLTLNVKSNTFMHSTHNPEIVNDNYDEKSLQPACVLHPKGVLKRLETQLHVEVEANNRRS